jgi:hypothetical protein
MRTVATFATIGLILLVIKSCFFIMKSCDEDGIKAPQTGECLWPFEKD